jgi:hypothetical protein
VISGDDAGQTDTVVPVTEPVEDVTDDPVWDDPTPEPQGA